MENTVLPRVKNKFSAWFESVNSFCMLYFERARIPRFSNSGRQCSQWIESIFWLVLVALAFCATIKISMKLLKRYEAESTALSIEKDHYYWNTSMSSFTICETANRIDKELFDNYCKDRGIVGQTKQEFYEFIESLANASYESFHLIREYESVEALRIEPKDYMALIQQLTEDKSRNPNQYTRVRAFVDTYDSIRCERILTEQGLCYTSNNFLATNLSDIYLLTGKQPDPTPQIEIPVGETGREINVLTGNLFDGDITYSIIGFAGNKTIYVHSPFETMNIAKARYFTENSYIFHTSVMEIVAEVDFQKNTKISQRNCRFTSESNLTHFPIYTRGLCLQECRLNMVYDLCGCIPHFYPNKIPNPKPVCHYKLLKSCVFNHTRMLMMLRDDNQTRTNCQCLQNCVNSEVFVILVEELLDSNQALGTTGVISKLREFPVVRYKRRIIFSLTDLLVSIGATASFITGFCALGIIEIVYFFTLRLFWHILGRKIEPMRRQNIAHEQEHAVPFYN